MAGAARGLGRVFALVLAMGLLAGCDGVVSWLANAYDGPLPEQKDISGETVIVRNVFTDPAGEVHLFYADRVKLLETKPHDINRVVEVHVDTPLAPAPKVGDVLRISTRFLGISEASNGPQVPNWPYDQYFEYPIGRHALTAAEPAAR